MRVACQVKNPDLFCGSFDASACGGASPVPRGKVGGRSSKELSPALGVPSPGKPVRGTGFEPFDSSLPVLCPINLNPCDKSDNPPVELLREEFAGAALDDAIRADHALLYPPCGAQVSIRGCIDGHLYGISAICGREWCTQCGGHRGRAHNRRVGQYLGMVQEWSIMAYAVLTVPPELREAFRDLRLLSKAGVAVRLWLRRQGIKRGVTRWHLFGEPGEGGMITEESPLSGPGFAPHLNVLCEAGYLQPDTLAALRRTWRLILERLSHLTMDGRGFADRTDALVIDWQYTWIKSAAGVRQAVHWLTYMMGPRFLDSKWDHFLALRMVGWRNCVRWGKGSGIIVWGLEDLGVEEKGGGDVKRQGGVSEVGRCVLAGDCPECGGKLKSLGVVPREKLIVLEDYGGGVYRLRALLGVNNKPKVKEERKSA